MIPINELRQGNYYRCKVYNGNNDVILPFTWQEYKYAHLFEPIPLTDEVLRAAGFTYDDSDDENRWLSLYVKLFRFEADQSTEFKEVYAYREKGFITKVTTLHQLQNLYFALTGSELEVSLTGIGNSPITDNK